MADYTRGESAQIIVGAAAFFVSKVADADPTDFVGGEDYKKTVSADETNWRNVGYTSNGLELMFEPDFGEVKVDQLLDVAKLFKQGMKVSMKTSFAEATLENLLLAVAGQSDDLSAGSLRLSAGDIGECPVERGLVAIGPGTGDCADSSTTERVYVAYRALSIESVTVSAKRDEATMFDVSFRMLPNDNASYGNITDRTWVPA
jgi:hypothetical protein